VESAAKELDQLTVGTDLTAVFWDVDRARPTRAHVYAEAPFYLSCAGRATDRPFPDEALLLWNRGDEVMIADAKATSVEHQGDQALLEMRLNDWRPCDDRRRYPRYPCSASAALRPFQFEEEGPPLDAVHGRTRDLSLSGAFVLVPEMLSVGTVIEFHSVLAAGVVIKALGVIARQVPEEEGLGVAFLEFLGDGQDDLEKYLSRVA
jgi:hypothetical protein